MKSEVQNLRERLEAIREAAEAYERDPINAYDRTSSWAKLGALLRLAKGEKIIQKPLDTESI